MSQLPPPTGRPVAVALRPDPWVELERQRRATAVRRRRRMAGATCLGIVMAAAGAVVAWQLLPQRDETPVRSEPVVAASTEPAVVTTSVRPSAVDLVQVDEVWLLDTGGGDYEWGVVLRSQVDEPIGEFSLTARFADVLGSHLRSETRTVALISDDLVRVGGSLSISGAPERIDVSVLRGRPLAEELRDAADVDAIEVRRVGTGTLGDDTLIGRIAIGDGGRGQSVDVSAVWRDDSGVVVASVFTDVDIRANRTQPHFDIPLRRNVVPPGPPSSVRVRWSS